MTKSILIKLFVEFDETKEITDRGKHALADVVSDDFQLDCLTGRNVK